MALSCISTIASSQFVNNGPTYLSFIYPTSLGVSANTITGATYNYTAGTGTNVYRNGKYNMMSTYNNTIHHIWRAFTLDSTKFYMTGVVTSNTQTIYNSATDGTSPGSTLTFTRQAYVSGTGVYQGGTTNTSQDVKTTYNTSLTSRGEMVQLKFPFRFVFRKLSIALGNTHIYGPCDIRVLGSNDNVTWTQVHFQTYTTAYTHGIVALVINNTTNTVPYAHHRFIWEKNNGGNVIVLEKMIVEGLAEVV